ncbi:hypothetical protein Tco_1543259 [Tanacetum coccineum]
MRRDINSLFGRVASLSKRVCIRETAHTLVEKKGKAKDKHYGKLISDLGNEVRCVDKMEERMTALENHVEGFVNAEERAECKKLKRDLEKRTWRTHFYACRMNESKEISIMLDFELMISIEKWFVGDLCLKKGQGKPLMFQLRLKRRVLHLSREDLLVILSTTVRRMIKESVDAAIVTEWERHTNAGNNVSGSGSARGLVIAPVIRECTFARFMKCNPHNVCGTEGAVELRR